ncbi:MAG: polysaccharide biosynthesis C-terminal domain-containing protein [Bacteroidales bacterium]|jgi:O-antigen/teichoic acid export membrane protein
MINKLLGTIGSRLLGAVLSLCILMISSKQLGAESLGTISLIILGVTIVQMVNNFVGGSALVYLIPRFDVFQLIIPSYIWAFVTAFICTFILNLLNLIPHEYYYHVMLLSLIQSLSSINLSLLLGKEKIKQYNIINVVQIILMISVLSVLIFTLDRKNVMSYIIALYISWGFSMISGFLLAIKLFRISDFKNIREVLKNILRYGTYLQLANIVQLFNYRLPYYFIENFIGRTAVGIYSAGVQLSEGLWLTGKSMSIVQYSKLSNTEDHEYSKKITLVFGKISFLITFFLLIILILLPQSVFAFFFGNDFHELPIVIISLASGILFFSLTFSLSSYFSGIGKPYHNTIAAAIGFVFTVILGLILIPRYKLAGAGITASVVYLSMLVYQLFFFLKISGAKAREMLLTTADFRLFMAELKNLLKKN